MSNHKEFNPVIGMLWKDSTDCQLVYWSQLPHPDKWTAKEIEKYKLSDKAMIFLCSVKEINFREYWGKYIKRVYSAHKIKYRPSAYTTSIAIVVLTVLRKKLRSLRIPELPNTEYLEATVAANRIRWKLIDRYRKTGTFYSASYFLTLVNQEVASIVKAIQQKGEKK